MSDALGMESSFLLVSLALAFCCEDNSVHALDKDSLMFLSFTSENLPTLSIYYFVLFVQIDILF